MSQIRLYIDEDSMNQALVRALRARNIDVVTVNETDTAGQLDEEQLILATEQGRVLYSHNIADFCQLHAEFLEVEKYHSGIALLAQDYSVGEQLKALSGYSVASIF
ncbi:MAG: DUF5615 family PIN-like protein [Cyanobacteria bacterium P01_F01_bin.150]